MSDFKVIETQEQFDEAIKARLVRDREAYAKKFEGWKSAEDIEKMTAEFTKQIKALEDAAAETQKQIAARDEEIKKSAQYKTDLVKTRIALEMGIPYQMANRLTGETEKEIREDAESFVKAIGSQKPIAPLGSNEPQVNGDSKAAAWQSFAASLITE